MAAAATPFAARCFKGIRILHVPELSGIPWLVHGFSTRPGGASTLAGKRVLNLGFTEWDSRDKVHANRRRLEKDHYSGRAEGRGDRDGVTFSTKVTGGYWKCH